MELMGMVWIMKNALNIVDILFILIISTISTIRIMNLSMNTDTYNKTTAWNPD